jgi:hypothetical protein
MEFFQANVPENNDHVYLHILFCPPTEVTVVDENEVEGSDKENEQEEPVNVVEQTDEEDSESEMSSSECEMSEEETFRSINRIIEYAIEYVTVTCS